MTIGNAKCFENPVFGKSPFLPAVFPDELTIFLAGCFKERLVLIRNLAFIEFFNVPPEFATGDQVLNVRFDDLQGGQERQLRELFTVTIFRELDRP